MLIRDRKINLVNLMLILYIFSIIVFDEGTTILKVIKVIFVGVSVLHLIFKKKLYIDRYIIWMTAFATFCMLSMQWSLSVENAKEILSALILNDICIFFVLNLFYDDRNRIKLIINTIIFSSIVLGVRVAIEYGTFIFLNGARGGGNGMISANTIGMIAAISSVLSIYKLKNQNQYKVLYITALVFNLTIMIFSASRKALLYFLIPVIIYYILNSKNVVSTIKKVLASIFIMILAFVAIMKVPFLYDSVGYRIETMINGFLGTGDTDASTGLRLAMIEWGYEWFQDRPYFGYGINNFKTLLGQQNTSYGSEGVYAHNNYIELLVDVGIIGTLIYYYIYLSILNKGIGKWKKLNLLQMIMLGILISCIINEYGSVSYYAKFNQLILALIWISMLDNSNGKIKEKNENGEQKKERQHK